MVYFIFLISSCTSSAVTFSTIPSFLTDIVDYMPADEEDKYTIAQASEPVDAEGRFVNKMVKVRRRSEITEVKASEVDYVDVSPKQLVSVAAAMIPFLEHDDVKRSLMGSNMQRQAVPLLYQSLQ